MTTTDKTHQKLMDSMRRTKAASSATPEAGTKRVTRKPARPVTKPDSTSLARPYGGIPDERRLAVADPYQAGFRVWPD